MSAIGVHLKQHRKLRGMSQLDLASASSSTPRYISFIETGRARPGKEVLNRIAAALNLTLRDTNELMASAGLPIVYPQQPLEHEDMQPIKRLIEHVLKKHEPYPAWVIAPGLTFLDSNNAAEKVFPGLVGMEPTALVDLWCGTSLGLDEPQRAYIIHQTLSGLRHEAFHYPHPAIPALLKQVEDYAADIDMPSGAIEPTVLTPTLIVNGKEVRTLTTVMRFDKVVNVTMAEIRIELVFPADEESEAILRSL